MERFIGLIVAEVDGKLVHKMGIIEWYQKNENLDEAAKMIVEKGSTVPVEMFVTE